ncbi:MAG: hypothetical protein QM813_02570 [Verrucomicrobiota bacterium]
MAINLAFEFETTLLRDGNFVIEFGQPFAQLSDLIFTLQHVGGFGFDFVARS